MQSFRLELPKSGLAETRDKNIRCSWLFLFNQLLTFQTSFGYIGGRDAGHESRWVWEDSQRTATYTNWNAGEPNGWIVENCAQMLTSGKWQDAVCDLFIFGFDTFKLPVVCERLLWIWMVLSPVWPDLANFCHFCKNFEIFGNIFKVYFIIGKVLNHFGTIFVRLDNFSLV